MAKKNDLKYVVKEINKIRNATSHHSYQFFMNSSHNEDYKDDGSDEDYVFDLMTYLYRLILVYLELKGMSEYLDEFKYSFSENIKDKKKVLIYGPINPDEEELMMLEEFRRFLLPFSDFSYNEQQEEGELNKLIQIIESTPHILTRCNVTPTSEADIYRQVEWVLGIYYSPRRKHKARFISHFKTYNPDILIPELKTSIEYKYVRGDGNVDDYLDQLVADSKVYKGDPHYENFIAALCIEVGIATEKQVRAAWKSRKFPKQWKLALSFIK
jgi:hypothetical protein